MDKVETFDGNGVLLGVTDSRELSIVKERKKEAVNVLRETHLDYGMWVYGYFWDTSQRARENVSGMVAAIAAGVPLPPNFVWRTRDNINVPFTAQMLVGLGAQTILFVNVVYNASWQIKELIDAAATMEEVDAIDITSHALWPNGNMDGSKPA